MQNQQSTGNLLKPLNIKRITLKNRLVMPPMATSKAEIDGKVSRNVLDYYAEKSEGGYISLIIIEHSFISQDGKASNNQLSIADDRVVESLKDLAKIIQNNGSKAVMQINHAGSAATKEVTGMDPAGPSAVPNPRRGTVPKEFTREDIKNLINSFKEAARRTKEAGFDGVEIHSAHGYLLNQFYSPLSNKRTDEYGGDLYGRIRVHLEIIKAVREVVCEDFPILLRLGACDYMEGGSTVEDAIIAVKEFEKAGIDIVDISGGFNGYMIPGDNEQGYFSPVTEAIKNAVSIPVILTGGITEAEAAERFLAEEKADLIGVGRAIYKDSNWAKNAIESLK
jgi:2,4-dienoyl-CoA reductase-like NADH-dependent reductase (Old Yellow Enzyme family)